MTGAAGFIGSHLAERLAASGYDAVGLDCFSPHYDVRLKRRNAAALAKQGVDILERDLAADPLEEIADEFDGLVHLAAQPGLSGDTPREAYERNNLLATRRLVEACRASVRLRAFVNISSSSVYGIHATGTEELEPQPASWYGETKLAAEREAMDACREGSLSACSLRLYSVYGERERPEKLFPKLMQAMSRGEPFPIYEGAEKHERSFTYVGDICEAVIACIQKWDRAKGEILNVGTETSSSTGEAIALVEEIMGQRARLQRLPARAGDQQATRANIAKIRTLIGWEPRTSLREGLERTAAWHASQSG